MKTTCLLRRENEKLLNKTEEYKIKLYNAEQDNVNLKHNISKNEKQISTMKKEIAFINYKEKHEGLENRHNLNRSSESVTEYTDKKYYFINLEIILIKRIGYYDLLVVS